MYGLEHSEGLPNPLVTLPPRLGGPELSGVLNLLEKDRELQELLGDVQERAELHRENYSSLKLEHTRLTHQVKILESEQEVLERENVGLKDQLRGIEERMVLETSHLRAQIKMIHEQGPTGQLKIKWVEKLREELDTNWKNKYKTAIDDLELLESQIKDLQQENNQLRHSYQAGISEVDTTMKEVVFTMEGKISSLEKENNRLRHLPAAMEKEKMNLKKSFNGLEQTVRTLTEGIDSREMELKQALAQLSMLEASLARREGKLKTRVVELDAEKEGLASQVRAGCEELERAEARIGALEQEKIRLQSQCEAAQRTSEEVQQEATVSLSRHQMEAARQQAAIRREKENVGKDLVDLEVKYADLKERFEKMYSIHYGEKSGLEQGLLLSQSQADERVREYETRAGQLTAKLKSLESNLRVLECENSSLRQQKDDVMSNLEGALQRVERDNAGLHKENCLMKRDIRNILDEREEAAERENTLHTVMKNLEKDLKELEAQNKSREKVLSEKVHKYNKLIHKLRSKLKLATAEKEEYKLKQRRVAGFVCPEEHGRVRGELMELQTKHKQFYSIIQNLKSCQTLVKETGIDSNFLNKSLDSIHRMKSLSIQFLKEDENS